MAFVDHGEFEAMKTPIGRRAPHCDKDQFHAKMTVSTSTICGCNKQNYTFMTAHFCVSLSSVWHLATYMILADHKATQRGT